MVIFTALCLSSHGQEISGFSGNSLPPPRPAYNVQDNAGLFARNQEQLKAISDRLYTLSEKNHFHIYVVIESAVMGSNPIELSARLQKAWLPDGDGFVIVYEVDSRSFGMGRPFDTAASPATIIPSYVTADIITKVHTRLEGEIESLRAEGKPMDNETLLDRLTLLLSKECGDYLAVRQAPDESKEGIKLGMATVGIMALVGLVALLGAQLFRRREQHQSRSFSFPAVEDPQRLGAPFGAKVSARRFRGPAQS